MSLKDFIRDTVGLGKDDVFKVDVKESFSFFNTDAEMTDKILSTFTEFKVEGRFVNVEVSKNPGGGGRNRKNRSSSSNRRRDRNSSSGKSENSGNRRSKRRKSDFF